MIPELEKLKIGGPAACCLGCGSRYVIWLAVGPQDNLLCLACGSCWHAAPGRPALGDMRECAGCDYQAICVAALP